MLNLAHNTNKALCVGMSGFGKSLLANQLILQSKARWYFIFDHEGQFAQRNRLKPALNADEILEQLKARRFVVFNPSEMFDDNEKGLNWFCGYMHRICEKLPGLKLFFCDEVQDLVGTGKLPKKVGKIFTSGRNREIDFVGCSLQYNFVHNKIRGQITHTYAFFTEEKLALKDLAMRGFNPDAVATLPKFHYILRTNTGIETRGIVTVPRG